MSQVDAKLPFAWYGWSANCDPELPSRPARGAAPVVTYCVVVFSILVQGLSIGSVVWHAIAAPSAD